MVTYTIKIFGYARKGFSVYHGLLYRKLLRHLPIIQFNFEATRKCNGRCAYCNIWKTPSKPEKELKPDEIRGYFKPRKLFEKVGEIGITGGEPILREDIVEVCQALREVCPNASLVVVTNGLMPERTLKVALKVRKEIDPKLHISVSLDGFEKSDEYLRGNPDHYSLAWRTAMLLKESGFPVGIGSTLTPINVNEAIEFRKFVESKGLNYSFECASESEHYYDNMGFGLGLSEKHLPVIDELSKMGHVTTFRFFQPEYLRSPRQIFPCFSGFCSFFLNCYGEVYPCIHLGLSLGNLRVDDFEKIWVREKARAIRRTIRDRLCHCWTCCEANASIKMLNLTLTKKAKVLPESPLLYEKTYSIKS